VPAAVPVGGVVVSEVDPAMPELSVKDVAPRLLVHPAGTPADTEKVVAGQPELLLLTRFTV